MQLKIAGHTRLRMRQRGISEADVRQVLTPHRIRLTRPGDYPDRMVHIVALEDGREIAVVTTPPVADAPPGGTVVVVTVWVHRRTA